MLAPNDVRLAKAARGCLFLKEQDSVDERAITNGEDQIDRIEILVAAKTPSEIGFRVNSGIKFAAQKTLAAKPWPHPKSNYRRNPGRVMVS